MGSVNTTRRRLVSGVLCVGLAVAAAVMVGQPARAYTISSTDDCDKIRWSIAAPIYRIHISEFFAGGGDAFDLVDMVEAVYEVIDEFNKVGGTSARVIIDSYTTDSTAFESGTWYNPKVPSIQIGFTDDPLEVDDDGLGVASVKRDVDEDDCTYDEAHMTFRDLSLQNWNFGTPADMGEDFHSAGYTDATGAIYFRPVFLHELLHAFGLSHSDDTYSFTNYGQRPWAGGGRDESEAIRPLPDDLRGLRHMYPSSSVQSEIALLNTWFVQASSAGEAANQFGLCAPSLGDGFSASPITTTCGYGGLDSGETEVCAGDRLYTRYAFANYSTEAADDINLRLYFSTDEVFDSTDTFSPTLREATVEAAHSNLLARSWQVPSGLVSGSTYHVIAHALGYTPSGAEVEDWIPLTGTVTAC
jgi:hypothetical protein